MPLAGGRAGDRKVPCLIWCLEEDGAVEGCTVTVKSNASWVMVTWGYPNGQTDMSGNITNSNFVTGGNNDVMFV